MTRDRVIAQATSVRLGAAMGVYGIRGIVLCSALATQWMLTEGVLSVPEGLATYSALLVVYLTFEIWRQHTRAEAPLFVIPAVMTSIVSFMIPFGLSNVIFWLPEESLATVGTPSTITPWMNTLVLLAVFGACCLWLGYDSGIGRGLGRRLQRRLKQVISEPARLNEPVVYVCVGLSLGARLLQLELDVFGYGSDSQRLMVLAPYREYLYLGETLGSWALIAVALERYRSHRPTLYARQLLWLILGYEVAWGFLSGFKARVVMPVLLVALAHYVQRGRFPRWLVPAMALGLVAAYSVIEPYRDLWNTGLGRSGLRGTASTLLGGVPVGSSAEPRASFALQVATRVNLTYVASAGLEYAAQGELPSGSPDFLGNILWSPVYAVVPRLLWDAKPLHDAGEWYARQVMGVDSNTSTGMSGVTYLNFAGGVLAVACGFLFVGIVQRAVFDGVRVLGPGGWLVIIGVLPALTQFEGAFDAFIVGVMRLLPLLSIAQYFLFPRAARSEAVIRLRSRPTPTTV